MSRFEFLAVSFHDVVTNEQQLLIELPVVGSPQFFENPFQLLDLERKCFVAGRSSVGSLLNPAQANQPRHSTSSFLRGCILGSSLLVKARNASLKSKPSCATRQVTPQGSEEHTSELQSRQY